MNHGKPQSLQHVANAAFLASLFVDYLNATSVPGWYCGPNFIKAEKLGSFAASQVCCSSHAVSSKANLRISYVVSVALHLQINYILGKNPMNMSYLVGYGPKFPRHVHHRGASIPNDHKKYSCTSGWKWRDSRNPNPNNITGAMVGGPIRTDNFQDVRTNYNYTEPTLAGNAGLVAALVSLTSSGGKGVDKNTIFSAVPPFYPPSPPPPSPWKP